MSRQLENTQTLPTAFLDHYEVMGTLQLPVLTPHAIASPLAKRRRVPTSQYLIPEHTLEKWKSKGAVDSYTSTSPTTAWARSFFDSSFHPTRDHLSVGNGEPTQNALSSVVGIANDLQTILGEAMETVTVMFPHKPTPTPNRGTLPYHLWPSLDQCDIYNI